MHEVEEIWHTPFWQVPPVHATPLARLVMGLQVRVAVLQPPPVQGKKRCAAATADTVSIGSRKYSSVRKPRETSSRYEAIMHFACSRRGHDNGPGV